MGFLDRFLASRKQKLNHKLRNKQATHQVGKEIKEKHESLGVNCKITDKDIKTADREVKKVKRNII